MKKNPKTKMTLILACLLIVVLAFTGCGKKKDSNSDTVSTDTKTTDGKNEDTKKESESTSELEGRYEVDPKTPAWQLDKKENTKLTWYVNADWWNTSWGEDVVTKQIKEDLNLDVEFITGDDTKLNTFFAGEDLPDIITIFDASNSVAQSANQWALPLQDLADKYDPYFYEVAKEDTLNWFKLSDEKTYGYPGYSNSQEDYDNGYIDAATAFVIRKDVYEALGKPSMGTPEEFLAVLAQIKEQFPDLLPFGFNSMTVNTGSLGADFQNFIGVPIENEDGTWYDRDMDEDYLKWVETFNEAYRQGLISDDNFADDHTAHEEKIKIGKYACIMIGGTPQRSGSLQVWLNSKPEAAYIAIDGPQSTMGRKPTLAQAGLSGWTITYITKNCSDQSKAIQIFTYLLSDYAGTLTTYGIEGVSYKINDASKYELLPEVKELKEKENERFKKEYRLTEFCLFGHDRYLSLGAEAIPSTTQMKEWGKGKLKTQFITENIEPDQGSAEQRVLSAIKTNWNTTLVSLIRAQDAETFKQILEDHKVFREDNNWNSIIEIRNQKMERNRTKLGL